MELNQRPKHFEPGSAGILRCNNPAEPCLQVMQTLGPKVSKIVPPLGFLNLKITNPEGPCTQ